MAAVNRWDREALWAGGSVAAVFGLPFAVLGRWALDHDWSTGTVVVANLGMIAGLVLGAGIAAWRQRRGTPLSHGLVVALATYLAVQAVFVVVRLVRGDEVRWGAVLFNTTFALGAGLIGGLLGQTLLRRGVQPPTAPNPEEVP